MIKNILPFYLSLLCLSLNAQNLTLDHTALSMSVDIMDADVQDDGDIELHAILTNNSDAEITVEWERVENSISEGWKSAVCIGDLCFSSAISTYTYTLASGESNDILMHIYPGEFPGNISGIIAGSADIDLLLRDANDSSVTTMANFLFQVTGASDVDDLNTKSVKLYPNPATDFFMLSNDSPIEMVEIYNLLGRKVKSFQAVKGQHYDVSDLNTGMYLVRLMADGEAIIKTINLQKR